MRFQTTVLLLLIQVAAYSQYYELGGFMGVANYKGELNLSSPIVPAEFNSAFGLFTRYNFNRHFAARAMLSKGQISGADANASEAAIRERNLSFRSDIIEFSLLGEVNLSPYAIREGKVSAPYLFAGISGFHFNPQAQMRGNWYDLQPIGTEGQGNPLLSNSPKYSRYQVSFPFGIGFKFSVNKKINLGFEFGARKTFTDYLDDVSNRYPDLEILSRANPRAAQLSFRVPEVKNDPNIPDPSGQLRGNPADKDWYFFTGITISVNMTDKYGLDFDKKYDVFKTEQPNPFEPIKEVKKKKGKSRKKANRQE